METLRGYLQTAHLGLVVLFLTSSHYSYHRIHPVLSRKFGIVKLWHLFLPLPIVSKGTYYHS